MLELNRYSVTNDAECMSQTLLTTPTHTNTHSEKLELDPGIYSFIPIVCHEFAIFRSPSIRELLFRFGREKKNFVL